MAGDNKVEIEVAAQTSGADKITALEKEIRTLESSLEQTSQGAQALSGLRQELEALGKQQSLIVNFKTLKTATEDAKTAFDAAQAKAQTLGAELAQTTTVSASQTRQFTAARKEVNDTLAAWQTHVKELQKARTALSDVGVDTKQLAAAQLDLKGKVNTATAQFSELKLGLNASAQGATKLGTESGASAAGIDKAGAAAKKTAGETQDLKKGLESISSQLETVKNGMLAFVGFQGFTGAVKSVAQLADEWQNMRARLQLALGAQTDINKAMDDVQSIAKQTYSSLDATATLYGKIASIGRDMGLSQQQALALTGDINKAIQLSGANAQASEAAITQLIQGLQSGVLRGEEFNSMMEQAPRLSKALADGLGVTTGQLRGMADQGKLTSQTVIEALQKQSDAIGKEFASLPLTIGRSVQNLQTEWQKYVATMDASTGASSAAAQAIESISKHLDDIAKLSATAGAAFTTAFAMNAVAALRAATVEVGLLGTATALLTKEVETLNTATKAFAIFAAFSAGNAFGEWLVNNTVWARKLGAVVFEIAGTIVNDLQLIQEATTALFTKDTIGKAVDRYKERADRLKATTISMFEDAEKAPAKVGASTDEATKKTEALSSAASLAGHNIANSSAAGAAGVAGIGHAADGARDALTKLAAQINAPAPKDNGITAITKDLIAAANRGQDLDGILRTALPGAIDKLSGPELVKFRAEFIRAMDDAKRALQDAIDTNKPRAEIDALRAKVDAFEKATTIGLGLVAKSAAQNLGVDVPLAFNTMGESFRKSDDDLAVLIRSFPQLKKEGVDTSAVVAQALEKMVDTAKSQAELERVEYRIKALGKAGEIAKPQVDALLDSAKTKATELKDRLEEATPGMQSLSEAAKKAGVDIGELTTGISKGFADGVKNVNNLADALYKAGNYSATAKNELAKALDQQLAAAKTVKEVELVIQAYQRLGDRGQLTGDELTKGLDKATDKLDEMKEGVNSLREAYHQLGLKTPEELQKIADANAQAWDKVKDDARLSVADLQKAFQQYADSAIAAAGEAGKAQVQAILEAEAAAKGLSVTFDETGKAIVKAMGTGAAAINNARGYMDAFQRSALAATAALEAQNAELERGIAAQEKANELAERAAELERKHRGVDKDGFVVDKNGNRLEMNVPTRGGVYEQAKGRGLSEAQALQIANQFVGDDGKQKGWEGTGKTWSVALNEAIEKIILANAADKVNEENKPNQQPQQKQQPQSSSKHTVTINLGGGKQQDFDMASVNDAANISSFLQQLDGAKKSAGY